MQTVSQEFKEGVYSGGALYNTTLRINGSLVPVSQIAKITINSPIIDTTTETFYVGSFISQSITIKFKNLDGLDIVSGNEVSLEIGQLIDNVYEYVPIGLYLIDDLAENYQTSCEITCLDYAIKFKPAIDYSPCFIDEKADVNTIIQYICDSCGVELGTDLSTLPNNDVEVGTYDSTISGKQWLSYLAEIKGCNLKMSRDGKLLFIPFKQEPVEEINALASKTFELGEKYQLTKIVYFDAIRNYTRGNDDGNTLYIRQDNPFITNENVIDNLANFMLYDEKETEIEETIEIDDGSSNKLAELNTYGNTKQTTTTGKSLYGGFTFSKDYLGIKFDYYTEGKISLYGTATGSALSMLSSEAVSNSYLITLTPNTYTLSCRRLYSIENISLQIVKSNGYLIVETGNNSSVTFTISENTDAFIRLRVDENTNVPYEVIYYLLEEGEVATEWEEYTGKKPSPSIDYPQEIQTLKNHFAYKVKNIDGSNYYTKTINLQQSDKLNNIGTIVDGTYTVDNINAVVSNNVITINGSTGDSQTGYFNLEIDLSQNLPKGLYELCINNTITQDITVKLSGSTSSWVSMLTINPEGIINTIVPSNKLIITIPERTTIDNLVFDVKVYNAYDIEMCSSPDNMYKDEFRRSTGKNLFDKNNYTEINATPNDTDIVIGSINRCIVMKCKPNTSYAVQKRNDGDTNRFALATSVQEPKNTNVSTTNYIRDDNTNTLIITSGVNDNYLTIQYYREAETVLSKQELLNSIQIEENTQATDLEPYGVGVWYKYSKITKKQFDGTENWIKGNVYTNTTDYRINSNIGAIATSTNDINAFCNKFVGNTSGASIDEECFWFNGNGYIRFRINTSTASTVNEFKNWLSSNNLILVFPLANPTVTIITNKNIIKELEDLRRVQLFEGTNIIENVPSSSLISPYFKLKYNANTNFTIWNLKNENYGDISLDAWDILKFNVGDKSYLTYNDNILDYEMNIATKIETKIPTKQKEVTTNVIRGDIPTNIKMLRTNLDYINNQVSILVQETSDLTERTSEMIQDALSTQNIFKITGGNNLIDNSQFLYDDPINNETNERTYWKITDNGTNPYNNLGNSYDASLIGITTSVAKIQLRDTILETTIENINNLKINQLYSMSYSYTQDDLTTTTVQLYENTTGNIIFERIYDNEQTSITKEELTFTANDNNYILKITTTTTSGNLDKGYFNLYDLMLNSGEIQQWSPARSEVWSTVIRMSQLGLSVVAEGSKIITLLTSEGFQVRKYSNGNIGVVVTQFNDTGLKTGIAETEEIHTGRYVMTEEVINNVEHHIEYFKESD